MKSSKARTIKEPTAGPESLPEGWCSVRIRDAFDHWGGMTPSKSNERFWGGSIPWVSSKDIKGRRIDGGTHFVTDAALRRTRLRMCDRGTVLVVVRSGVLVHSLPVAIVNKPVVINQDLKALTSGDETLNAWLAEFLRSRASEILEANRKDGTTVQSVRVDELLNLDIPMPPAAEQQRVLALLEEIHRKLDSAEDHFERVPKFLSRFRQAVLAAACSGKLTEEWRSKKPSVESGIELLRRAIQERSRSAQAKGRKGVSYDGDGGPIALDDVPDLPTFPDDWGLTSVGFVARRLQYGTSTRADASPERGIPILRMGNIQDGNLDFRDLKFVDPSQDLAPFYLEDGDLLFNRTNSPELVGKVAAFRREGPHVFASYLIRVSCEPELVSNAFLCHWINSPWGRAWARKVRTDGVSQSNINASLLARMPLPLPSLSEQAEVIRRVDALMRLADGVSDRLRRAVLRAESLRRSILDRAFRGELVPTEADLATREGEGVRDGGGVAVAGAGEWIARCRDVGRAPPSLGAASASVEGNAVD